MGIAVHGCTDAARAAAAIVLLEPGLGTIADGVYTSRAIFQRMRSYSLYRITSTIHFLLFLFVAIIAFDFTIPAVLIVLITVMNDAATLVISVDNAQISKRPDKWRIGQLIFLSFVLAILLALASFAHFFIFKYAIGWDDDMLGTVMSCMYLLRACIHRLLSCPTQVNCYACSRPMLLLCCPSLGCTAQSCSLHRFAPPPPEITNYLTHSLAAAMQYTGDRDVPADELVPALRHLQHAPAGPVLDEAAQLDLLRRRDGHSGAIYQTTAQHSFAVSLVAVPTLISSALCFATQVIAMFFAIYGVLSSAIGWPASIAIMAVSLVYFMLLDQVKLFVYKYWNLELTVKLWPTRERRLLRDEKRALKATAARFARGARAGRRLIHAAMFVNGARGRFNLEPVEVVVKKEEAGQAGKAEVVTTFIKRGESLTEMTPVVPTKVVE